MDDDVKWIAGLVQTIDRWIMNRSSDCSMIEACDTTDSAVVDRLLRLGELVGAQMDDPSRSQSEEFQMVCCGLAWVYYTDTMDGKGDLDAADVMLDYALQLGSARADLYAAARSVFEGDFAPALERLQEASKGPAIIRKSASAVLARLAGRVKSPFVAELRAVWPESAEEAQYWQNESDAVKIY